MQTGAEMSGIVPRCWICGGTADSSEHIFKAADLKRMFDRDGYSFDDLPFHFSERGSARVPGPKSKRIKYPPLICRRCNNDRTADFDRAYDRLSAWFAASQANGGPEIMDLSAVFGLQWRDGVQLFRRYCAKCLGCRIVAAEVVLPAKFPNPVSGANMEDLVISICRAQPFRNIPDYRQELFAEMLGKGGLLVTFSRSHFERSGERKISAAIWWEHIGHFQINYWYAVPPNPLLGDPFDGSKQFYQLPAVDLGMEEMHASMEAWHSQQLD